MRRGGPGTDTAMLTGVRPGMGIEAFREIGQKPIELNLL